jgi:hypothetical protein
VIINHSAVRQRERETTRERRDKGDEREEIQRVQERGTVTRETRERDGAVRLES